MRTHALVSWAVLGLVVTTPVLVQIGPADAAPARATCHGAVATIIGTSGDDTLTGTPGRDVIVGRAGDDRIRGLGGGDVLCGNVGADIIQGGPGADRLYGGTGVGEGRHDQDDGDVAYDGDLLVGGPGDDHVDVGYDEDPLTDGPLWESISFGQSRHGVDVDLTKGTARGQGHDTVVGRTLTVVGTRQDDTVRAGKYALACYGGLGDDKAIGSKYADQLYPGSESPLAWRGLPDRIGVGGHDAAYGRAGEDRIESGEGGGRDTLRGGSGADHITYDGPAAVSLDAGAGADEVSVQLPDRDGSFVSMGLSGDAGDKLVLEPPKVKRIDWDMATGSFLIDGEDRGIQVVSSPDTWLNGRQVRWTVSGTDLAEKLMITSGPTTFYGRGGDDYFRGGFYTDAFDGGDGDDTYAVDLGGTNSCASVEHDPSSACAS